MGLTRPGATLAALGPRNAFEATNEADVLRLLFGAQGATPNAGVKIEAPLLAMYAKGVAVKVQCELEGVELIALVTRNNQHPLNDVVRLAGAVGYFNTRIRLERSSPVVAYVKAGDALYSATASVKLSRGGYGT
jgi:sulfur-oxidizing protein SoxY